MKYREQLAAFLKRTPASPEAMLATTIEKAQQYALTIQKPDGDWQGAFNCNASIEAEHILLSYYMGYNDYHQWQKLANFIWQQQVDDGGWPQYYGAGGDLSTTVECYLALKLAGFSPDDERMQRAREFILARGGIPKTRIFTKCWLALFDQWDINSLPSIPPEIMLLPNWFPVNIYEFASWARATIVPMSIIFTKKRVCKLPATATVDELFPTPRSEVDYSLPRPKKFLGWGGFFWLVDKALKLYDRFPWHPGRNYAIRKAVKWIEERQEADGGWGGIQGPWVYSLMALYSLGYDLNYPIIKKGIEGLKSFSIETETTLQIQACISNVWDTCLMLIGLHDSGFDLAHEQLRHSITWLLNKQVSVPGDWAVKNPHTPPGGWLFELHNNYYPDVDTSSEVIIALNLVRQQQVQPQTEFDEAIKRGVCWVLSMQSKNGGWGAFDINNNRSFLAKMPFFDFGETLDPPCVDVTSHILEMLAYLGYTSSHPQIKRALTFIYQQQESNGVWFGRWGVNYIYGTGSVLPALAALNEDMTQPAVRRAVAWLLDHQNPDGGWGESCASYVDRSQEGKGPSTPSQTSWALLALIAAGEINHPATANGIAYLCNTQTAEGTWEEKYFTGTGFPGYGIGKRSIGTPQETTTLAQGNDLPAGFMIGYGLYRHYWPLMVLGRYHNAITNKA